MTTKTKKTNANKGQKKLALNKSTLRDLSVEGKGNAIRGGQIKTDADTACFGTLA